MNRITTLALAALLLTPAAHAAAKKAAKKAAAKAPADSEEQMEELKSASAVDKKRFEAYLKDRLAKINEHHQARMDFLAKEADTWNSFWSKVRDERKVFEIRITRQTLDLFESLASLDPKDQPTTIADFEKMQANVVKSFETQQKQKMAEFFAARDERWKEFAAEQEQEREQFLAEAANDWQQSKQALRNPDAAASMPGYEGKKAAADDEDASSDDDQQAPVKVAKKARPASAPKPKPHHMDPNDAWH
jgi:hypothetical protein